MVEGKGKDLLGKRASPGRSGHFSAVEEAGGHFGWLTTANRFWSAKFI